MRKVMNVLMKVKDMYDESDDVLMKRKEENEKVGLKLNIQKTKITASGPLTSWQIDEETVERARDFILGWPKSLQMVTVVAKRWP